MELLKLLSASEIVAQVVNFLLLLFVLRLLLWKPLLAAIDARKKKIASEFESIGQQKVAMEKLKGDYEVKLLTIELDAKKRIQQAIVEGNDRAETIKQDAHREAQRVIDRARADIKYELGAAKEELKTRIVDLAMRATESVIQERFTEKEDKRLIEDFLSRVDEIE